MDIFHPSRPAESVAALPLRASGPCPVCVIDVHRDLVRFECDADLQARLGYRSDRARSLANFAVTADAIRQTEALYSANDEGVA